MHDIDQASVMCSPRADTFSHCLVRCSYVWSVSLYDFFPVLLMGGTLVIPPPGGHMNVQCDPGRIQGGFLKVHRTRA